MKKIFTIFNHLDTRKKGQFFLLLFFSLIEILVDFVSLASIYPLLLNIVDSEIRFFIFEEFIRELSIDSLLIIILFLFVLKNVLIIVLNFLRETFYQNIFYELSTKLFLKYLSQKWEFFTNINSAKMIHNIRNETSLISNLLASYVSFYIEIIMLIVVGSFLLYVNFFISSLVIIFFLIFSSIYKFFIQKKIVKISENRQYYEKKLLNNLYQTFNNFKLVKIFNIIDYSLNDFKNKIFPYSRNMRNWKTIQTVPRNIIEIFSIIFFVGVMIYLSLNNNDLAKYLPSIGIFVVFFFRLIPLFNKITIAFQNIQYSKPAVNEIIKVLELEVTYDADKLKKLKFENEIKVKNLKFDFKNKDKKNLMIHDLNFTIYKGTTVGIVGPSGIGKSTLADLLIGVIKPDSGSILVDNKNITEKTKEWQKNIGYVSQSIYLNDDTILENILLGRKKNDEDYEEKTKKLLKIVDLWEYVKDQKNGMHQNVGEKAIKMSGGQIQRIGIARALFKEPSFLILDEATSGLDKEVEENIINNIKQNYKKITILIISHRESTLTFCDEIIKIK